MQTAFISGRGLENNIRLPQRCIARARILHFPRGHIVQEIRAVPEALCYILNGTLRVVKLSEDSDRRVLFYISRNNFIGEVRYLAEETLSFRVETLTDVTVALFSREDTLDMLGSDEDFRRCLFRGIARKMQGLGSELVTTAYRDNRERLLEILETFSTIQEGQTVVTMSQTELGEYMGVHRVTINRTLRRLQAEGMITIGRERILLHSL